MNKCKWVIEKGDLERENWDKIVSCLEKTGREYERINYIPFTCEQPKTRFGDEDCVVAFGCLGLVRAVAQKSKWVPGVWCDFDKLKYSYYLSYWGKFSIHKKYCYQTLAEVARLSQQWFSHYSNPMFHDQVFIRPDDNFKSFNGELVAPEHWESFFNNVNCYEPEHHTLCLISQPTKIVAEWRFVIADKKVITGSQYRINRSAEIDPSFEQGAAEFAEEVANDGYEPHSIYVMDICKTEHGKYRLMEIGSLNGAGLYAMDIEKIVEKASEIAEREWAEIYE